MLVLQLHRTGCSGGGEAGAVCAGAAAQSDPWNVISFVLFKLLLQLCSQRWHGLLKSHPPGDLSLTTGPITPPPRAAYRR